MRIFILCGILFFALPVSTQPADQDSLRIVRAVGYASIFGGDVGRARDEALADARVRALESLGVFLEGGTYLSQGRVLDRGIQTRPRGYIEQQKIVGEEVHRDLPQVYKIEIEAWVKPGLSPQDLRKFLRKFSIVIDIPHTVLHEGEEHSKPMRRRGLELALREALIAEGFEVYNWQQLRRIQQIDYLLDGMQRQDRQALGVLTAYAMAEVVVTGGVDVEFVSKGPETDLATGERVRGLFYRAFPNVVAMEGGTGQEVASYSHSDGIQGYQLSSSKASQLAVRKATEQSLPSILKGMRKYAESNKITVVVRVSGFSDLSEYRKYQRLLRGLRWVDRVEADDFQVGGVSSYQIVYKEKFFFLLSQMHRLPGLDQVQGSTRRISAVYTGLPKQGARSRR